MVVWPKLAGLLVIGYLCMTRSFAYVGVQPLFIGEVALALFVVLKPRVVLGTWATAVLRNSPLNALGISLLLFVLYGIGELGRGILAGDPVVDALKYFIFNYYTLYLFLGIWIGLRAPSFLRKLVHTVAWVHGIYGLVWIVALRNVGMHIPGSEVPLFGLPAGGAVAILGLMCFERDLRPVWPVLALNIAVTAAMQARATWLGLALGMVVWGLLTGRLGRVAAMGLAGLLVVGVMDLADLRLGVGRSSEVSLDETLSRVIAPIDLDLAKQLSPTAQHSANTVEWRQKWWKQIWLSVQSSTLVEAFGHGYGFDLFALAPADVRAGQAEEIRTPHSVFYYALGYTGWVGVLLFSIMQLAVLRLLWKAYKLSGQPAGVVWWFMGISMAFVEASFETPYKAIPFYLLVGMSMGPALQAREEGHEHFARPPLPAADGRRAAQPYPAGT